MRRAAAPGDGEREGECRQQPVLHDVLEGCESYIRRARLSAPPRDLSKMDHKGV